MINSYPSIQTLGHRYLENLFKGPVVIQEKIDGSQFSFGNIDGKLCCRSKGQEIHVEAPEKMFAAAVATAKRCFQNNALLPGYTFRCEYLSKPKHNTLSYGRVPAGNLVLFDVDTGGEHYVSMKSLRHWAEINGIEPVPVFFEGVIDGYSDKGVVLRARPDFLTVQGLLEQESVLGGCKLEGVVIKNYNVFGLDHKILVGKYVSPDFKEVHRHEWPKTNLRFHDIVQQIVLDYKTSPRWCKAVQHLREQGILVDRPEDIGALIMEVRADVNREEIDIIKDRLYQHFWPQISRGIVDGLAVWYKQRLANNLSALNDQPGSHVKSSDSCGSGTAAGQNPTDP